jgi:hypothetical protein
MRKLLPASLGLALIACNAPDTSLLLRGAVVGERDMMTGACMFDPEGGENLLGIRLDVETQLSLYLLVRADNTLTPPITDIDSDPDDQLKYREDITPIRFDYRWECDSLGFASDLGPLYLPQFSTTQPFCLDNRDDTTKSFVGFDVINATGASIPAGATGGVEIRPIPAQLGLAIRDMFALAALAEGCCATAAGCEGVQNGANQACSDLAAYFADVGIINNQVEEAQRYRPFSLFNGNAGPAAMLGVGAPTYQLRMRGVLEGTTGSGDTITSNEYIQDIGIGFSVGGSSICSGF